MSELPLISLNVRGLRDKLKRRCIFNKMYKKCKGLILLQETHSSSDVEQIWQAEFRDDIIFSHGTSQSRGTAILIHNEIEVKIHQQIIDKDGRYIILDIEFDGTRYTIGNFYAPTRDNEKDQIRNLEIFKNAIATLDSTNIILGGDFNLYLDPDLDKGPYIKDSNDNDNYRNDLTSLLEALDMVDIWRIKHPEDKKFTWHQGKKSSRLDYFFISEHLENIITETNISPGIRTDHSLISITLNKLPNIKRGKGMWKFNCSLLKEETFIEDVKECISLNASKYDTLEDKGLKWELIKMEIRKVTISYASRKKKNRDNYYLELTKELSRLQNQMDCNPDENTIDLFNSTKEEIQKIDNHRLEGVIVRSRTKWIEDGEKNTSYFLSLEKRNYQNKLITQVQTETGTITEPHKILDEAKNFYKKLYSESNNGNENNPEYLNIFTSQIKHNIPKLTEEQKLTCEGLITVSECARALKQLKNKKTPGSDGLAVEFYKFFWTDIKEFVVQSLNYSMIKGELSIEQKRGILTLIPKKNKDRHFLKNWRPISLLNTDYKILTKSLAMRIRNVMPTIIHEDQTGYIKSRFIGQNIRIISDIISYTSLTRTPGILIAIDFEKAFDTVRWSFLEKALQVYNFGEQFQRWIKVLYTNITTSVINNGHTSPYFNLERGIRQGCPLSAFLFILVVELLAHKIRCDVSIDGIKVKTKVIKITQLADDTTCFVKNVRSLKQVLQVMNCFYECAGLKINVEKTKAMYLGSLQGTSDKPLNLSWTDGPIECLGMKFTSSMCNLYEYNYKDKICKLKNLLLLWSRRKLSLKGKVTVINNLAISPFIYLAQVEYVPAKVIEEINSIILQFLWDNKPAKVAKDVIISRIENGGLKMVDFERKVKALQICWVKRMLTESHSGWIELVEFFYQTENISFFFQCNSSAHMLDASTPIFYKEILKHWSEIHNVVPSTIEDICSEIIWNNIHIQINRKPFYWKTWHNKGIKHIRDLLDENGNFLSMDELNTKYDINCNFILVLQVRQSIPYQWRQKLKNFTSENTSGTTQDLCQIKIRNRLIDIRYVCNREIYWSLIDQINKKPACIKKWTEEYQLNDDIWYNIFQIPYMTTRETRLQSLQYKLLHRIIPCNVWLKQIKIKATDECDYCQEKDTIEHFFLECQSVKEFWNFLFNWWETVTNTELDVIKEELLFGFVQSSDYYKVLNYCVLLAKSYIHRQRLFHNNKLSLYQYQVELKQKIQIEKYICYSNNQVNKFKKWTFLLNAIQP